MSDCHRVTVEARADQKGVVPDGLPDCRIGQTQKAVVGGHKVAAS
jgi:hypothetical protein